MSKIINERTAMLFAAPIGIRVLEWMECFLFLFYCVVPMIGVEVVVGAVS